jgi:hypothetical protein
MDLDEFMRTLGANADVAAFEYAMSGAKFPDARFTEYHGNRTNPWVGDTPPTTYA